MTRSRLAQAGRVDARPVRCADARGNQRRSRPSLHYIAQRCDDCAHGRETQDDIIERLVDAIDLPIGRWNRDGRLLFCNAPYVAWAARPREQLDRPHARRAVRRCSLGCAHEPAFAAAFEGQRPSLRAPLDAPRAARRAGRACRSSPTATRGGQHRSGVHDRLRRRRRRAASARRCRRRGDASIASPTTSRTRSPTSTATACCASSTRRTATPPGSSRAGADRPAHRRGARRKRWDEHRPYFERALGRRDDAVHAAHRAGRSRHALDAHQLRARLRRRRRRSSASTR